MSTEISMTFRVGCRYRCDMRFNHDRGLIAEWIPRPPKRLIGDELADYRRGRDAFVVEIADMIGGIKMVVE